MTQATDSVVWNGVTYHIRLNVAATGGRLSIFESEDQPGYGPPRHVHHQEDETFLVLDGEVAFLLGETSQTCLPGDTVFVPRGTVHTFCVRGHKPARMLTVMTPGGFEGFFREMSKGAFRIPQDMAQIVAIASAYHLEFTGPPLT